MTQKEIDEWNTYIKYLELEIPKDYDVLEPLTQYFTKDQLEFLEEIYQQELKK
jgi:hypothetical protein